MKPGKVPFKIMRPANPSAVINELDKLSDDDKALSQPVTSPLVNSYKENYNVEVQLSLRVLTRLVLLFLV